jgi:hypothetical protein
MENLKFKVVKTVKLPIEWKIEDIQKFPVHEHTISEQQEIVVSYQYKPTSKFEKDKFIEFMRRYLMKKYSTECVELILCQSNLNNYLNNSTK